MKLLIGLLVASVAWNGVLTLPARSPSDDVELIAVPKPRPVFGLRGDPVVDDEVDFKNYKGTIDTGVGYPFLQPHPHPFSFNFGFFDSFEDIFRRLRAHLIPLERPSIGDSDSGSSEEGSVLDAKKFNQTSTVKVVDGLKIEVNETVYGDDNSSFKIRIINVRPVGSGEDVEETEITEEGSKKPVPDETVTSGPEPKKDNKEVTDAESDDEDTEDRREPLEKSPQDNEHSSDEQYARTTMLPSSDEDNGANLNAAFVTDNSLAMADEGDSDSDGERGNGNIESETNKPDDAAAVLDQDDVDVEQQPHGDAVNSRLLANERLTIENNEESEVNDNFNESPSTDATATDDDDADDAHDDDAAKDDAMLMAKLQELELSGQDGGESFANDGADIVEDGVADADGASDGDGDDDDDDERLTAHSNYKQREDVASSDDESVGEKVEMTPEFYAEWSDLGDGNRPGDITPIERNDLDNEIDAYDSVPVDLSNDIAVNDIAAAQSDYARNPDAEFIDVDGTMMGDSMPKFERLSTSYQPDSHNMK